MNKIQIVNLLGAVECLFLGAGHFLRLSFLNTVGLIGFEIHGANWSILGGSLCASDFSGKDGSGSCRAGKDEIPCGCLL